VFDYDFYNMTALHWACKKGYYNIAELLLNYQSDIDGVDILYRTPLILSIEENHLDVT
jgi:ankyrin repeat protein